MHPTIVYELTKARIADQQRHIEQAALAEAARRARRTSIPQRRHLARALAGRALALVTACCRAGHAQARPLPCCPVPRLCTSRA